MKAIIHANLYDYEDYKTDVYILFDDLIREVGPMKDFPGADEIVDASSAMVLPGLINGHAHLYGAFFRGISLPLHPRTFSELLKQFFWKIDAQLDEESTYYGAKVYGLEHIKHGVTTVFDHHASGRQIDGSLDVLKQAIVDETGMRGLFCFETSDRFPIKECIRENVRFAKKETSSMARGLFGMHASLSLCNETLAQVASQIGELPLHVHVAESLEDEVECINRYGQRIVERFDAFGLLNKDSILAHAVHIDGHEAELIAERDCVVAINPASNMNTGVGLPDVRLLKEKKVRTMIGNDLLGIDLTQDYRNTVFAMHLRYGSPMSFGAEDVLAYIREVYDYASRRLMLPVGRIKKGYAADLIVVPHHVPVFLGEHNIFSYVLDGLFNVFHPRDVFVAGQCRLKNYETAWDEEAIYAKARDVSQALWKRIGV